MVDPLDAYRDKVLIIRNPDGSYIVKDKKTGEEVALDTDDALKILGEEEKA